MRMRHLLLAIGAGLALGCADVPTGTARPATPRPGPSFILSGQPDAGEHPYVVLLAVDAGATEWTCTGSLLSPTVALTAAHCTEGALAVRVYPAEAPVPGVGFYTGIAAAYPGWCAACGPGLPNFARGDVGVVVLSEPVPTSVVGEYALLPTPGAADALAARAVIDQVGYGVQRRIPGGGPPGWAGDVVRHQAPAELIPGESVFSDASLRLTANAAQGKGGPCLGDSGGPNLIGDTDVVLAVTSWGTNRNCAGVRYAFRVDTPDVLAWIQSFL